jgi:uncharacterized protein (UPF0264 family)
VPFALSIKQPWAALVAHGRKTIEVRRSSTLRRGRVLIHAARIPDERPEAWAHVTPALLATTRLRGGIIGQAELVGCNTYATPAAFALDRAAHLNLPSWFVGGPLYGFVFARARLLDFRRCSGSLHFFEVDGPAAPAETACQLLVSVRSADEAQAALDGGADVIDVKEPRNGPLGRATDAVLAEVVKAVAGRKPVSAALGELAEAVDPCVVPGVSFVKCGLAGLGGRSHWQRQLAALRAHMARLPDPPAVVAVAYADWKKARAPAWSDVADVALRQPGGVLLVDTFDKTLQALGNNSRPASLLDCLAVQEVRQLCARARAGGVRLALAGSLRLPHILQLVDARPTWFAVRGAVCDSNDRDGAVHALMVQSLAELLRWKQQPAMSGS